MVRHFWVIKQFNNEISIIVLLLACLLTSASAQPIYINRNKNNAEFWLIAGLKNMKLRYQLIVNDTSLLMQSQDNRFTPFSYYFNFNRAGKCRFEQITYGCDTCYQLSIKYILSRKRFHWKQVDSTRYLSKASRQLQLSTNSSLHSYSLRYLAIKPDDYRKLLDKATSTKH